MTRDELCALIKNYVPYNAQETADQQIMLDLLEHEVNIFLRDNLFAHMTASGWVVNSTRDKVLMAYHNLYNSWAWLGGHADGEVDLAQVALKEVEEESGIHNLKLISPDILSLEVLTVNGHEKRGQYVPSHLHLNLTFLIEADDSTPLKVKPDENCAVAWLTPEEAIKASSEPWFVDRIYSKLLKKLL